jgi:hypothetical protein
MLVLVEDNILFYMYIQSNYLPKFFLNIVEIMDVPIKVAVQCIQGRFSSPNIKAGTNEWQGSLMRLTQKPKRKCPSQP